MALIFAGITFSNGFAFNSVNLFSRIHGAASYRQGEVEPGTLPRLRFNPYPSAMMLHDPLAYEETQTSTVVLRGAMQAPERLEYFSVVPGIDSDAVVAHTKYPLIRIGRCRNVNLGNVLAPILDCVPQQVSKQPQKLSLVCLDDRQ